MDDFVTKEQAAEMIKVARVRKGVTWAQLASAIDQPKEWTTAALLGSHALARGQAAKIAEVLDLDDRVVEALQAQPYRTAHPDVMSDPTIYRFHEALQVYGPAIKELIHEEFGDGIMSAINFNLRVERRHDDGGDRVVVTFDGKFLDYRW